jgi:hypothetical protein
MRLLACTEGNEDYWTFQHDDQRECTHSYYQYPAMMVPQMLGQLIRTITSTEERIERLYDPFVGSGTVIGECMSHGLSFLGQDVNPLAILVSRAKCGPFDDVSLETSKACLVQKIRADQSDQVDIDLTYLQKWFCSDIAVSLSRIRRAIQSEEKRRFFWVALAETVRLCSNSRTSTFKLHIREPADLERRHLELDAFDTFCNILEANFAAFLAQRQLLLTGGFLEADGTYAGQLDVVHRDSGLPFEGPLNDMLVTSPPYGDNQTDLAPEK